MTQKDETLFQHGVHKYLRADVYHEKTNNPYRSGMPDVYYEAELMKWVEYKFLIRVPKRPTSLIIPELSPLQRRWLTRNWDNGHEPWVIVGCEEGGVILNTPTSWKEGVTRAEYDKLLLSREAIAKLIMKAIV